MAVGACAKRLLEEFQIDVLGFVVELGAIKTNIKKWIFCVKYAISKSKLRCPDKNLKSNDKKIDLAKKRRYTWDFEIRAINVPLIRYLPQWDERLNVKLSYALMSIPLLRSRNWVGI